MLLQAQLEKMVNQSLQALQDNTERVGLDITDLIAQGDDVLQIATVVKQAQDTLQQSVAAVKTSCQQQLKVLKLGTSSVIFLSVHDRNDTAG